VRRIAEQSGLSNNATAWAYVTPVVTVEAVMVYYSSAAVKGDQYFPSYRGWDGANWGSEYSAPGVTSTASGWYVLKKCPESVRDEWILGVRDEDGHVNVQVYDGDAESWGNIKELSTYGSYILDRTFDIAYEQNSGDAVVVYNPSGGEGPDAMDYEIWDGSNWTKYDLSISTSGSGTATVWVRLVADPATSSDEIILAMQDSSNDLTVAVWDGSNWGNAEVLEWDIDNRDSFNFDVAYEYLSGKAMVVWSENTVGTPQYIQWDGSNWGTEGNCQDHGYSDIRWLRLASNPNNNDILLGTLDAGNDINVSTWSAAGGVWGPVREVETDAPGYGKRYFDVAYSSTSGDGFVVWADGTSVPKYDKYSGSWAGEGTCSGITSNTEWIGLYPDDDSDDIMLMTSDAETTPDINVQKWNGSSWGSPEEVETNSSNLYECFALAYLSVSAPPSGDTTEPSAITTIAASTATLTGGVKLEWESPGDDGWTDALPLGSQYKIQYATYNISWDKDNAQITISTSGTNPYTVVSTTTYLSRETTYYFRIWTRDEVPNWSDISYGATVWCRIRPDAVTTLSSLALDDGTGDVQLTWSSPGDDGTTGNITDGQWKIRYSTISSVDWTTDSSEWTDFDDKYQLLLNTTSVSALSGQTQNITGLHGSVTYYFRLWTRDENTGENSPGNWSSVSNASTVTVTAVIGISISPSTYDYGALDVSSAVVNGTTITVTNAGNITETYSLFSSSAIGSGKGWLIKDSPGNDEFSLSAGFNTVEPSSTTFGADNILSTTTVKCTAAKFAINETGINVIKAALRKVWFLLKTPDSTSTIDQKEITVTITAGTP